MRYKWLNKEGNNKLILFFNGWGMDECVVKHLNCEDYDVLMFYDYNTLDSDFDFNSLNIYTEKNLIAWSMGVMVGGKYLDKLGDRRASLNQWCKDKLVEHKEYIKEYGDDLPEVKEWTWYKSMNK